MVLNVTPEKGRIVKRENIWFIHSGGGANSEYQVLTDLIWDEDGGLGKFWLYIALRLKPN